MLGLVYSTPNGSFPYLASTEYSPFANTSTSSFGITLFWASATFPASINFNPVHIRTNGVRDDSSWYCVKVVLLVRPDEPSTTWDSPNSISLFIDCLLSNSALTVPVMGVPNILLLIDIFKNLQRLV